MDLGDALYHQPGADAEVAKEADAALDKALALNSKDTRAYTLSLKTNAYKLKNYDKAFEAYNKLMASGAKIGSEDQMLVVSLYTSQHRFAEARSISPFENVRLVRLGQIRHNHRAGGRRVRGVGGKFVEVHCEAVPLVVLGARHVVGRVAARKPDWTFLARHQRQ